MQKEKYNKKKEEEANNAGLHSAHEKGHFQATAH